MKREQVVSSNILSIGYDKSTSILEIEMKNHKIYQYIDVPSFIYDGIMGSDSKGKYFAEHIKSTYRWREVIENFSVGTLTDHGTVKEAGVLTTETVTDCHGLNDE